MPRKKEEVKEWFEEVIETYRSKTEDLSKEIEKKTSRGEQYHSPCQIEVFWIGEPVEWQILVHTHDEDREDKEIIVNGPFEGDEFIENVERIMEEDRWQRTSEDSNGEQGKKRLSRIFAYRLQNYVQHISGGVFKDTSDHSPLGNKGRVFPKKGWISLIRGNIANNSPNEFVEDIVKRAKDKIEPKDLSEDQRREDSKSEKAKKTIKKGVGTYIYPLTWVGGEPQKSFEEIVFNHPSQPIEPGVVLNYDFDGDELIITRDGFIGMIDTDIGLASETLNTIFGTALLFGCFWESVQRLEMMDFKINIDEEKVTTLPTETSSLRTYLSSPFTGSEIPTRRENPKIKFEMIIDKAKRISEQGDKGVLISLIYSATHLRDDEYTPSFLLSWILIEQVLNQLIDNRLKNDFGVNHDRRNKITDSPNWGMQEKIELSEVIGIIDEDSRSFLQDKRSTRNNIVHKMERADKEESEELFDFAANLVGMYVWNKDEDNSLKFEFPVDGIDIKPSKEII